MSDINIILNLNKADVQSISTTVEGNSVFYYVTLSRSDFICPFCFSKIHSHGYITKKIHHKVLINKDTYIIYKQRRYYCPCCHSTHLEHNPWADSRSSISHMTKIHVMKYLKGQEANFSSTAKHFNLPISTIINIFDELGHMNRLSFPKVLSIDEFYAMRKSKEKYAVVLLDFQSMQIVDVFLGRTKKKWNNYLQLIPKREMNNVEYIITDMFETYRSVQRSYFPKAKLCVDSFHIIKNINELVKKQRIKVMNSYEPNSVEYYLLKKFDWLIMKDSANIHETKGKYNRKLKRYINYQGLLEMILTIDPLLKEAYELKEEYLIFNQTSTIENARENLAHILALFSSSNLESFRQFNNTLIRWYEEIINSFHIINHRRVSNGPIESINSRIKTIIKVANGFRNFSRLRNKIMYVINKESKITLHDETINIKTPQKPRGAYKH